MRRLFLQVALLTFLLCIGLRITSAEAYYVSSTTPADDPSYLAPVAVDTVIEFVFSSDVYWSQIYNNNKLRITLRQKNTTANLLSPSDFKRWSSFLGSWVDPDFGFKYGVKYRAYPSANLLPDTEYELVFSKNIKDAAGNTLGTSDTIIHFKTAAATPPAATIIDNDPTNGATNIALNLSEITVRFNQQVDSTEGGSTSILNSSNFSVSPAVSGTYSYDSGAAQGKLTLSSALSASTTYTVTVNNVKDANGQTVVGQPYTWTFTTRSSDTTRPTASVVTPTATTSIPVSQDFIIQFSEAMDPASITAANLYISGVTGTVTYDSINNRATLTTSSSLGYGTDYTLTVSTSVRDLSLNTMLNPLTFAFTTVQFTTPAAMNDYCQIPPFISGGSVKPNVLLMVDNSGSMNEFAYKNKGYGDSNYDTSYDSSKSYYGYFDTAYMYQYDTSASGHFKIDTSKTMNRESFWSGNFLNWLTMRRVDVVRKVLVGGKITPRSLANANYALIHDGPDRDYYKRYGNNYYIVDDGKIYSCGTTANCSKKDATTYNGKVYVGENPPEEGLVVKMWDKINFGIMFFNVGNRLEDSQNSVRDGGYPAVDLGSTGTNLITQVENTDPETWTPLGETFFEATRYFMATDSAYNGGTYSGKDPIEHSCQKNFVLILTDGEATKDRNLPGGNWGTPITDSHFNVKTWMDKIADNEGSTSQWNVSPNTSEGSYYLEGAAYWAHMTDLRSDTLGKSNISSNQNITTYAVYAFDDSNLGRDLLQKTCKYGGFDDSDGTGKPDQQSKWDSDANGVPDTYYEAQDGSKLEGELLAALLDILTRVSSGTAASILNNSEGSGASLLQAVFYPKKAFESGTEVSWIGEMQNLWYYLDPYLQLSTIRVDTESDYKLNLKDDNIAQFYFDGDKTRVRLLKDVKGDGTQLTLVGASYDPDDTTNVKSLWRAGRLLWSRDLVSDNRTIFTHTGVSTLDVLENTANESTHLANFASSVLKDDTTIQGYLQAANATEADKIISYVRGIDQSGYRSRTAIIAGASGTWRLGDIVSSTPKIQGNVALNAYSQSTPTGYNDSSYKKFAQSNDYKNRGMAYVGANDGMLHTFRMGVLKELTDPCRVTSPSADCAADKSQLNDYTVDSSGANSNTRADASDKLGREEWTFIPRQMLPYLKYLADPDYSHLFYVDGAQLIVDVATNKPATYDTSKYPNCGTNYWECPKQTVFSNDVSGDTTNNLDTSNTSWRTVLIGGTGLGGASRNRGGTGLCTGGGSDCVKTPVADLGYSGYYALDITNPQAPKYLWEFPGNTTAVGNLGFATTGPVIIRVGDKNQNGRWFAVFASGPTGPIETITHQFLGRSDQNLKLFVVDIATGALVRTIDTGITNAFAGSVSNSAIDNDRNSSTKSGFYQDDAAYIGYVQKVDASNWTRGGVIRLVTRESVDPSTWSTSTVIADDPTSSTINIGPVTTAITKLQDRVNKKQWLYFGSGRYFFKNATQVDDGDTQRRLFGVTEPWYNGTTQKIDPTMTGSLSFSDLDDQTTSPSSALASGKKGWYINLDTSALNDGYSSERVITDPVASTSGVVYFTTFRPTSDVCGYGGGSYIWAVGYATGTSAPGNAMKGKLLVQVSTGAFAEISMSSGFTAKDNRRTTDMIQGVPPKAQGLSILANPKPIKKIIHYQEK
ncbi:Ig-like domain-containing protein [Pelobacter propionicus]|uniref:Tfp pilus assembly protein tip-associated adhesin PilY1-like protein n=1 Tax=Pelobacter propionicus (strain DSM 2379 / NBRC 103807 / OttBd1) TaxID=338966 RepID=A1AMP4_PELPD|nr:Ig-like domain-containing protein [Pelobacter propionicus]ABK98614.1 Tfp pilus assembly protein tip-associated adhesin PilY1-like protein [Pelobacter propionicus DSM 2379]